MSLDDSTGFLTRRSTGGNISRIVNLAKQLALPLPFRGGKRRCAGRPPKGDKALVSHAPRPRFARPTPAHVTLRMDNELPGLRSSRRFAIVSGCFEKSRGKLGLRLVEFSVLGNHLHLIVEADSSAALSRGMQGLCIRIAKALNAALDRSGRVFADHYHSRLLLTPTEVASTIAYVLDNAARHYDRHSNEDCFSSTTLELRRLLALPRCWLLTVGWKRARPNALRALGRFYDV